MRRRSVDPVCMPESLSDVVTHMPDALVTVDREWCYTFVNERAAETIGKPAAELLGRTVWEASPQLAEPGIAGELRRAMEEHVPARFESRAIGDVWNEIRAFPTEEGMAILYSDISARKEAEQQALRLFGTTSLLLEASEALTSDTGLDKVLPAFADALLRAVPHKRIAIASYDERRKEVEVLYSKGEAAFPVGSVFPREAVSRPAHQALDEKRPVLVDYDRLSDEESGAARRNRARLSLVVPLVLAGRSIGLVFMDSPDQRINVDRRDLDIVQGIASQAAAVIQNALLLKTESEARAEAKRELEKTRLLLEAGRALAGRVELPEVLGKLAEVLVSSTAHTRSFVFLWDESERLVRQAASAGIRPIPSGQTFAFDDASTPTKRALTERRTVVVDFDALPEAERGRALSTQGSHVVMAVPIVWQGRLLGLIGVDDPDERREFTQSEIELFEGIAAQAAAAIENGRLYEAERESARLSQALSGIDHSVHSTLETQEVFRRVVSEAAVALRCESAAVGTREDGMWVLRYEYRLGRGLIGQRFSDEDLRIAKLATERQDVVAVDDALEHAFVNPETRRTFEARAFLVVPLIARDEVVGVIYFIYHSRVHRFSPAEVDFGRRLSASLGLAIANARAYQAEREAQQTARQELSATTQLLRAADELAKPVELDRVLVVLADVLLRAVGHTRALVLLWDEARQAATLSASSGIAPPPVGTVFPFEDLSTETQRVLTEKRVRVADFDTLPLAERRVAERTGSHLALLVPMLQGDRLVGIVSIDDPGERREFTEREIETTRGISAQATVAIQNSRLFEASRREVARTTVLREVAASASERDMRAIGDDVLDTVMSRLGAKAGVVYRLDEQERLLHETGIRGYPERMRPLFAEVPLDESSITAQAVLRDRLLTLSLEQLPPATRRRADLAGETGTCWMTVPAHAHGRLFGALTLVFEAQRRLDEEDFALFGSVGDQLGVALERAELFEAEQRRARLGEEIAAIDRSLHATLSSEEILKNISEYTAKALGVATCRVLIRENGRWFTRGGYNVPDILLEEGAFADEQVPVFLDVLAEGRVLTVADAAHHPLMNPETVKRYGIVSSLIAPLTAPGVEGVLVLNSFTEPRRFSEAEIQFAGQVATSLALAIANARRFESERSIAETLQSALLSLPEHIPGIEFAHLYRSATEAARVGGDFYDLFGLGGSRIGITIGDISGHGIDAAVLTSLVKNTIRVQATQEGNAPNDVMAVANDILFDNSPADIFATVFFGVLDLEDGRLDYCNAGHTTGVCVCSRRGASPLPANSPLIGALSDVRFELATERMDECDLLFLYTDGLTEARRDGELFGEERLFDLLAHESGAGVEPTVRDVIDAVLSFSRGTLSDDLAILAVQRAVEG